MNLFKVFVLTDERVLDKELTYTVFQIWKEK